MFHCTDGGVVDVYVPSFSMPKAYEFWPVQWDPSTNVEPSDKVSTVRCRPSVMYPPRLTV